jgi:hypothetical protein
LVVNPRLTFKNLLGKDADLEKELEQFQRALERDEIVNL